MTKIFDDTIDFGLYYRETEHKAHIHPASVYTQALRDKLTQQQAKHLIGLPWEKTIGYFDFRPSEVTMWAGQNGHGKSQMSLQVALSLIGQFQTICIASFEMKPVTTLQRMARLYMGFNPYDPNNHAGGGLEAINDQLTDFDGFCKNKLWIYDQTNQVETQKVVGMVRYCAKELRLQHVVIDNLAKCIRNEDDYNGQKSFIDDMMTIARDYGIHIHIVHHLKKPPKETDRPDKSDVKGSGSIVDQIDNLFLVWRNKAKEDKAKAGQTPDQTEPDQVLFCRKQRNYDGIYEGEPTVLLWHHKASGQYLSSPTDTPMFFHNYPHRMS